MLKYKWLILQELAFHKKFMNMAYGAINFIKNDIQSKILFSLLHLNLDFIILKVAIA